MTEFNYQKQAQGHYAKAPVIILGSGASMVFGLPSMGELANYIKSNTDTAQIPGDQLGNWTEFCGLLDTSVDLETALHQVNFSQEITQLTRMFHPFLNLAGDMAKLGWFALTGNQTSIKP